MQTGNMNALKIFCFLFFIAAGTVKLNAQNLIVTVAGNGDFGYAGDSGQAVLAQLGGPEGVCLDKRGNMYIADEANNVIRKVILSTGEIITIAGTGTAGYYGDGGLADTAQLNAPAAVFADDSGNIFIADWGNDVIREIVDTNGAIITVAGNGIPGFNGDSMQAQQTELNSPSAVFVDKAGNIYIADTDNSRIRKVDANNLVSTIAGDTTQGYAGDNGPAVSAELYAPYGVTLDGSGNIFISDGNSTIRRVDATSGIITTIAGNANPGYTGDGGLAVNAQINSPADVCLDKSGNLYIADYSNNVVRMINAQNNIITTVAGSDTIGYWGDGGLADTARLNGPTGVFVDTAGFLYIADFNNNRIREVGPGLVQYTAINTVAAPAGYSIFPNPSNGRFTVKATDAAEEFRIAVYNTVGQIIYQSTLQGVSTQVDLSNASAGIYFLKAQSDKHSFEQKLVVN